jgi:ATP-dependent helicase YprA (DUF1998 family)
MIVAKPVVANQYWILKQDDQKIGNIQASADGFVVKIQNQISSYKTIPMVRKKANIEFEPAEKVSKPATDSVHGYSTGCRAHNAMWNVQLKLPLFTKTSKSKWFAAGWYTVKQHRAWKAIHNPKLIVLERYKYQGPFHTKEQANESI